MSDALHEHEEHVGNERQRDGEGAGGDDLSAEVQAQRAQDRSAEPLGDDECSHRGERDRRDDGDPQAGDDRRHRERQLHAPERLSRSQAHAARSLEHFGRRGAEAGEGVTEEDQQRVADEGDLDGSDREAGERDEQLEERQTRNRVDHRRGDGERPLGEAEPVREQRRGQRDGEADPDRDQRQLDVLDEPRLQDGAPVVAHPVGAEEAVLGDARARLAEIRDHRLIRHDSSSVSRWIVRTPRGSWFGPTTSSSSDPSLSISESASRSVVLSSATGLTTPFTGPSSMSDRRFSDRRLRPRSWPDEARHEVVGGMSEDLVGRVVLDEHASLAQDRDPVADQDRLVDVVGDEDDRLPHLVLDPQQLLLQPHAGDRVERAERLVHQHHRRVGRERSGEADTLALAARDLRRVAGAVVLRRQVDEVEQLVHAHGDLLLRPAEQLRHGGDVLGDGHVREEADLLDHVADAAAELGLVQSVDALPIDPHVARGELDEPVDELHGGRLAAAGGADEAADVAGRNRKRQVVDRRSCAAGVTLSRVVEDDLDRLTPPPHSP